MNHPRPGYELVQQIGGGGFSTYVIFWHLKIPYNISLLFSVFRAVNVKDHRVAACKVIAITEQSTDKERKTIEKEMRIHSALKHQNILEFLNGFVVELKHKHAYVPGIYMLMELAAGGDLFDKIGRYSSKCTYSHAEYIFASSSRRRRWR